MIEINIPGFGDLRLSHLVMDYNGTLAIDGRLLAGVSEALRDLAERLEIHILTADTFGLAAGELDHLPLKLFILPLESQAEAKRDHVGLLGADRVVAIGNGRNDREMLKAAAVGVAVIQKEGVSGETLAAADVVTAHVLNALDLLRNPRRLVATLRS